MDADAANADAAQVLQAEIAQKEADVHLAEVPSADAPSASKTGKKRPGKELKASNTRRERASEDRDAGESGNATAHAVIGIIKKKSNKIVKSKTGEKRKRFDIPVSPNEDDVEEEIRRGKRSDDHSSSFTSSSAFNSTSSFSSSSSKSSSDLILRISRKNYKFHLPEILYSFSASYLFLHRI